MSSLCASRRADIQQQKPSVVPLPLVQLRLRGLPRLLVRINTIIRLGVRVIARRVRVRLAIHSRLVLAQLQCVGLVIAIAE